jgi:GAF domain-containing protein
MDEQTWLHHHFEVRAIYEISRAINSSYSQQEVLDATLERIVTDLGYRAATLRLLDVERRQLELKAAYGLSEAYLKKGPFDFTKSGIDQIVLTGKPATLHDVRHDPGFQYPEAAAREGLASMLAVPLALRDRVIGVLHVYTAELHVFGEEEQAFLGAIGNLGAQAIQRTQLFEAFQRVAHQINSSLELSQVLTKLVIESVNELNAKAGSVRLLGPRRLRLHLAVAYGLSQTYLQKGEIRVAESPIDQRALQEGHPVTVTDLEKEGGFQYPEEARREGIRSVLVLPMRVGSTLVGVMRLYSAQVRRFSSEEIDFAAAVAELGAVAIENAKLHEALKERLEAMKEDVDGWYRFLALS